MSKPFTWKPIVLSFDFVPFDNLFADDPTGWWNCPDVKIAMPHEPLDPRYVGVPGTLKIRGQTYKAVIRSCTTEAANQSVPILGELAHRYLGEEPETALDVMILEDRSPGSLDIPGLMIEFNWKSF